MPNKIRNWISRLSETGGKLSEADLSGLAENPQQLEASKRVRLALRIVALQARLDDLAKYPDVAYDAPMTEVGLTALPDDPAPAQEPEPKTMPARPNKPKKKSFSAVSLDDAAGLLSAFGSLATSSDQEPPADEGPRTKEG